MELITYKPDQGRHGRQIAFALLTVLVWYGSMTLYSFLSWEWARKSLGWTIPVVNIELTPAFLIAVGVFLALLWTLRFAINHPKAADLLIDTEGEMRRVTWPSWQETLNGSVVVIITVVALLVVLSSADFMFSRIFERWVF